MCAQYSKRKTVNIYRAKVNQFMKKVWLFLYFRTSITSINIFLPRRRVPLPNSALFIHSFFISSPPKFSCTSSISFVSSSHHHPFLLLILLIRLPFPEQRLHFLPCSSAFQAVPPVNSTPPPPITLYLIKLPFLLFILLLFLFLCI